MKHLTQRGSPSRRSPPRKRSRQSKTAASQAFFRAFDSEGFVPSGSSVRAKAVHLRWVDRLVEKVVKPTGMRPEMVASRLSYGLECLRYVAYAMSLGFQSPFGIQGRRARGARAGLRALCTSVLDVAVSRGQADVLRWLKDLASDARREALGDLSGFKRSGVAEVRKYFRGFWSLQGLSREGRREALLQFSSFARALPEPPASVVNRNLLKHKECLTTPFNAGEEACSSIRDWVRGWADAFLPESAAVEGCLSTSASFELPRSRGGALGVLKGLLDWYRLDTVRGEDNGPWFTVFGGPPRWTVKSRETLALRGGVAPREEVEYLYDKTWCENQGLDLVQWEALREQLFLRDACLQQVTPILRGERLPSCKQAAVKTRGGKARIVTSIEAPFVYLAQMWRPVLLSGLRHWGPTALVLKEDHLVALQDWMSDLPQVDNRLAVIRSVDMSEATDRFPLDLMRAAAEGIADHFGLDRNGWEYLLLRASVGQYNMSCADGTVVKTSRGILMGLPTSWSLLCLYNGWLWSRAHGSPLRLVAQEEDCSPLDLCLICGDDLLGLTSRLASDRYTAYLEETGGKVSEGKDYLSLDCGLFTEAAVDLAQRRIIAVASVKGLTVMGDADEPPWFSAGPAASQVAHSVTGPLRSRVSALAAWHHRKVVQQMRRAGILPFVPRSLGGGGFPGPTSEAVDVECAPRGFRRAVRILMSGQVSDLDALKSLLGLESVWRSQQLAGSSTFFSEISENVWSQFEARVREGLRLFDSGVCTLRASCVESVYDLVQSRCTSLLGCYVLALGLPESKDRRETLKKTADRFRSWVKKINDLVPRNRLAGGTRALWVGWTRFRARLMRLAVRSWQGKKLEITTFGAVDASRLPSGRYVNEPLRKRRKLL